MSDFMKDQGPFYFKTRLSLVMLTGLKASNLLELRNHLESVPESSVYHHTHHFLQQHQFLTPEPPNDFAFWVTSVLSEDRVGEQLAAIDTIRFQSLEDLRRAIIRTLDQFLSKNIKLREAPEGEEFHFMKTRLFSLPTPYVARDLKEFAECMSKVSIHSLYYHMFESLLRPPLGVNDFSDWLSRSLGEKILAEQISKLDPYTHTMEGLRKRIITLVEKRIKELSHVQV